jgi:hypothetical protein
MFCSFFFPQETMGHLNKLLKIDTELTIITELLLKDSISSDLKLSTAKVLSFLSALLMSGEKKEQIFWLSKKISG